MLTEYIPHQDECRFVLLKIVEQAVRDYVSLEKSTAPIEQFHYGTAQAFLFDDEYAIAYGGENITLQDILSILDIEIEWFRESIADLKQKKLKNAILKLSKLKQKPDIES